MIVSNFILIRAVPEHLPTTAKPEAMLLNLDAVTAFQPNVVNGRPAGVLIRLREGVTLRSDADWRQLAQDMRSKSFTQLDGYGL